MNWLSNPDEVTAVASAFAIFAGAALVLLLLLILSKPRTRR